MERPALLSCFFPAYNEEDNIGPLIEEAAAALAGLADTFEIVVVDDGSSDRTAEIVTGHAERDARVRLVAHGDNRGYGAALRTGLGSCRGELICLIDGDRQFAVADVALLLGALGEADIVAGYRIERADTWHRRFIGSVYATVLRTAFDAGVRDVDCGFKLFRREVIERVGPDLTSSGAFLSAELLIRSRAAGFTISEVGIPHHPRTAGRSKGATPAVVWKTLVELVRLRKRLRAARTSTSGSSRSSR